MLKISAKHNLKSKEHNGDYLPEELIYEKMNLGLDSINIAPEFGLIETNTYLREIKDPEMFDEFWRICYESKRWEKWVSSDFNPFEEKAQLIKICGQYILSHNDFITNIKSLFPKIDEKIKHNIITKLNSLHGN